MVDYGSMIVKEYCSAGFSNKLLQAQFIQKTLSKKFLRGKGRKEGMFTQRLRKFIDGISLHGPIQLACQGQRNASID